MPLSPPAPREHIHSRDVSYRGYAREDGLWDIEAELRDTKTYGFEGEGKRYQAGDRIHNMLIRTTVDTAMTVVAVEVSMEAAPNPECQMARPPVQSIVGCSMGPGWGKQLQERLGGVQGCSHLRELLFNMATVAFQTIPAYRSVLRRRAGVDDGADPARRPPFHLGKCMAWDLSGPLVARQYPQFHIAQDGETPDPTVSTVPPKPRHP